MGGWRGCGVGVWNFGLGCDTVDDINPRLP